MMEFHVSRACRDKYQFDQLLFSQNGNVIFANFQAARQFAQQINAQKKPDEAGFVSPGQINALGLIDEIFHLIVAEYYQEYGKSIREGLYAELVSKLGKQQVEDSLEAFLKEFPPVDVYQGKISLKDYLAGSTEGISHDQLALEELLMLWLTDANPAASPYAELFEDRKLQKTTAYNRLVDGIQVYFKQQPVFGPENQDLITMLRTPALVVPQSLSGQLEYIRQHWAKYIGKYLYRLLGSLDMLKEEERAIFAGPGPTLVPDYSGLDLEGERFSPDSDWMPKVVMIAKNTFVWLNQLSRQYQRSIEHLDQIPDETLDQLARWGFTGLWLIGLWERSDASRRIKQLCGNPDAVSSAYSLARYQIAERLGGDAAYQNLSHRAGQRGIRLASDMVPNHMGIDSDWVYDHPDWFIGQGYSPFPTYSFNGPDLSQNPDISINVEDHYYTRSDAAVVFKRYDHRNGDTRFIYHGNDGTSMPWNDTAQLNYLNPQVREAVIQTILSVARKFPIIRFDAAMTLTKKHYQRLWFPQPGTGGDIPSRAEHAMTKEEFDRAMPEEFWREVVERVAKEVPDTLLLAEAFWLMEGYFVRTLGMHRVYNSAFMNMLRNEENDKYRQLIKNTLVYDPQILKRYVNFMNNPDEKTAVEQFGKGDKYFGICTVMGTMPGLPMFGHGQIEGYAEKYGMEYYRPYWDETPDQDLVHRHESEIFPILHRRRIFAGVENFRLYDFFTSSGSVDENVFAYSNRDGAEAALVVYHNRFGTTSGWIKTSVPYLVKGGESSHLETQELADALQLGGDVRTFVTFRDNIEKLEYIRSVQEIRERGMFFALDAYKHHVLMDFRLVSGGEYEQLNAHLNGRGVPSLDAARKEIVLGPVLQPLGKVIDPTNLSNLVDLANENDVHQPFESLLSNNLNLMREAGFALQRQGLANSADLDAASKVMEKGLRQILALDALEKQLGLADKKMSPQLSTTLQEVDPRAKFVLLIWNFLSNLAGPANEPDCAQAVRRLLGEAPVANLVIETLKGLGFGDYEAYKAYQAIQWMLVKTDWLAQKELKPSDLMEDWLQDELFKDYLELNEFNQVVWFNKEKFETMLDYMHIAAIIRYASDPQISSVEQAEAVLRAEPLFGQLRRAMAQSEYRLDKLITALG